MDYLFGTAEQPKTIGSRAVELSSSYPQRRAEALKQFESKLFEYLEAEIVRAASQGHARLSVRFDRIFASDLMPCDELVLDFDEEEGELMRGALERWADAQHLSLRESESTAYKIYIWWGDDE